MANSQMTPEAVKAKSNQLEVSPSKDDESSPVYGLRKSAGEAHRSTSNAGGLCESGFKTGGKGERKKYRTT